MKTKRTEVLNLIHTGLLCWLRIHAGILTKKRSGMSKSTVYKKRDSAERPQMPTPVNKNVDKKFTERLKKNVEKNPTTTIRKTAKVFKVD